MPKADSLLDRLRLSALGRAVPSSVQAKVRRGLDWFHRPSLARQALEERALTNDILGNAIYQEAFSSPRFQEPKRLLRHGFKVYSQNDEDGILEEIFRRIGETNRSFVEFGAGDGRENCTLYCLLKGWRGAWIDGSAVCFEVIRRHMADYQQDGRLKAKHSFVTAENIEALFQELEVPAEADLLSIDIDGNDFWIWSAIERYRPRVVAIEYNPSFNRSVSCVVPYNQKAIWQNSNYYGASLKALEHLGRKKGYSLVGCSYIGVNAFFVRNDCVGDRFAEPFTAENHYEPGRHFIRLRNGHAAGVGPVVTIPGDQEARRAGL